MAMGVVARNSSAMASMACLRSLNVLLGIPTASYIAFHPIPFARMKAILCMGMSSRYLRPSLTPIYFLRANPSLVRAL